MKKQLKKLTLGEMSDNLWSTLYQTPFILNKQIDRTTWLRYKLYKGFLIVHRFNKIVYQELNK